MDGKHVLNELCNRSGRSRSNISAAIGRDPHYLTSVINRGSVCRADTLAMICEECGYHLAIVPHGRKLPKDAIVIDPAE